MTSEQPSRNRLLLYYAYIHIFVKVYEQLFLHLLTEHLLGYRMRPVCFNFVEICDFKVDSLCKMLANTRNPCVMSHQYFSSMSKLLQLWLAYSLYLAKKNSGIIYGQLLVVARRPKLFSSQIAIKSELQVINYNYLWELSQNDFAPGFLVFASVLQRSLIFTCLKFQ